MPHVEFIPGDYLNTDAVHNVINYVLTDKPSNQLCQFCGGRYVYFNDIDMAVSHFMKTKYIYQQEDSKQIIHLIISFSPTETMNEVLLLNIGYLIASRYANFQTVFAVHTDQAHLHLHMAINTVSFLDGKRYHYGKDESFILKELIKDYLPFS